MRTQQRNTGFAITLKDDTSLGSAPVIAIDYEGNFEVVNIAGSISEARDMIAWDRRNRLAQVAAGKSVFCPERYELHARGLQGRFTIAAELEF